MKYGDIAQSAKKLQLAALSVSASIKSGMFKSAFNGYGIEFDSVREYELGDDTRAIDWNLQARSGKTFVKLYREEKDLTIFVCADLSDSMKSGSQGKTAKEKTVETAALLGFAAENMQASFGAVIFNSKQRFLFIPQKGGKYVLSILKSAKECASLNNSFKGTAVKESLKTALKVLRTKSIVIIISDFKAEGYEKELKLLSVRHDVICMRLVNNFEQMLPAAGALPFTDYETGVRAVLPTSSKHFQNERIRKHNEELKRWKNLCLKNRAYYLTVNLNADIVKTLNSFFVSAPVLNQQPRRKRRGMLFS